MAKSQTVNVPVRVSPTRTILAEIHAVATDAKGSLVTANGMRWTVGK